MTVPHFLLGASLLFWGWQTGLMPLAVIMAALLEGARWIRFRVNLSPVDFRRIADFNTVVFVALLAFVYLTRQSTRFIFTFLQWVPVALLPVILAQVYSTAGKIDPGAIFWSLRKPAGDGTPAMTGMDLRYPYLFAVILTSGAANARTPWFFAGICVLVAWSLWPCRNQRYSTALWAALLAAVVLAGYGGQFGLNRLQVYLAETVPRWLSMSGDKADTYRSMTAIGELGQMKLSDAILFRVETDQGRPPPVLLRRASFNVYVPSASGTWVATQTSFQKVDPETDGVSWKFGGASGGREAAIIDSLRNGRGILKVPTGCFEIRDLPVGDLDKNIYGALRVKDGPGLVRYRVFYADNTVLDSPPGAGDLIIPDQLRQVIAQVARELKLSGEQPAGIVARVGDFFRDHFTYSLVLRGGGSGALQEFLISSRAGHCEFFATATVLLLREAGVPARYATGFSVQDFSRMEGRYVVRARHAHAWALAFVDGAWRDLDTTPAGWGEFEEQNAAWWTPFSDTWSWLSFKVSQWRWLERERPEAGPVLWVLLAAAALLSGWFLRRKSLTLIRKGPAIMEKADLRPGLDSEFYEIERMLAGAGNVRQKWEPVSAWAARIEADAKIDPLIVELHYRLRFDPAGLSDPDREALKEAVRSWLSLAERK